MRKFILGILLFSSIILINAKSTRGEGPKTVKFINLEESEQDSLSDDNFDRKRRVPYYFPAQYTRTFLKRFQDDENEDGFDRKRRIPYYFPSRLTYPSNDFYDNDDDDETTLDKRMSEKRKRGIMYYYPNYAYDFLNNNKEKSSDGFKRFVNPWKRFDKRNLMETLKNDDPTSFGYDKRANL